ncbi:unnamed protein product [Vitrella brassicaformis CCMP3155]|uniref:Uncharacterized protein n=1 Tax=Vitrella brassicaformis (strain CCMP3155) TaxID=1169540 RepID=A0A0G4GBS5_VITBC|nr:unnamed protein product [Vitrella brassicaformis CCMP3155]|eukprot:CEM26470.1 unnamed protein product [Vitrella brassicaformis CCMP3155]
MLKSTSHREGEDLESAPRPPPPRDFAACLKERETPSRAPRHDRRGAGAAWHGVFIVMRGMRVFNLSVAALDFIPVCFLITGLAYGHVGTVYPGGERPVNRGGPWDETDETGMGFIATGICFLLLSVICNLYLAPPI